MTAPELVVVGLRTWPEVRADFLGHWFVYLSMPLVAAFVGYVTKLLFLQMLYKPQEFRGVGRIGWQGIIPARAGKVAATTIDLMTQNLLKPEELLDRFDVRDALEELREPMATVVDVAARSMADKLRPGLWDSLPEAGRRAVHQRVRAIAPAIADHLIADMRADMTRYLDLKYLAVTTLVRNKAKLIDLMKAVGDRALAFVRRTGLVFGFVIGVIQMVCWAYFHNPWIMPAFGFAVGFLSDWLALNMLFHPRQPKRFLGLITFHGVLHAQREQITRDYAKILANDLFSPEIMFEAVLDGPSSDKLFDSISREVGDAIDRQAGVVQPLVLLTIGTERYRQFKLMVVQLMRGRFEGTIGAVTDYARRALDIENTIVEKMSQLTDEEFESILRPVFKDDEPLVILVGAILGGIIGELQILIIEQLGAT